MYIGQYSHTVDSKNRVFLPVKFRGKNKIFVITKGLEGCLYLYDYAQWEKVLEKLESMELSDKVQQRAFKRALLSGAHEVEPDFQGRILLPCNLKDYARIKIEAVIIGVGSRVEIWDRLKWERYYKDQADGSFKNLSSKLEI